MVYPSWVGYMWRVGLVAVAVAALVPYAVVTMQISMWASVGIAVATVGAAILSVVSGVIDVSPRHCPKCDGLQAPVGQSLGNRLSFLLRIELLFATVVMLLSWCEHAGKSSHMFSILSAALAGAMVLAIAQLGVYKTCTECDCRRYTLAGMTLASTCHYHF